MREFLRFLNAPCRDIAALISASMDRDLPRGQRWAVRVHLAYCVACRAYRRHLVFLRSVLRAAAAQELEDRDDAETALAPAESLSADARRRITQLLDEQ